MIKIIFEREPTADHRYSSVDYLEMRIDDSANLEHMLIHYAEFLRAMGYNLPGELVVEDE